VDTGATYIVDLTTLSQLFESVTSARELRLIDYNCPIHLHPGALHGHHLLFYDSQMTYGLRYVVGA